MDRRALLKQTGGLTAAVLLAGCSTFTDSKESPSPGTLIVTNEHTIPHIITIRVRDGPQNQLGNPITPHSQVAIEPGEERTYPEWLTSGSSGITAGDYSVEIQLDDRQEKGFQFNPKPAGGEPTFVHVEVTDTGEFRWIVQTLQ